MTYSPVADGLTVNGYDVSDVFDCLVCLDTGLDPDCAGHRLPNGALLVCGCPECGGEDAIEPSDEAA